MRILLVTLFLLPVLTLAQTEPPDFPPPPRPPPGGVPLRAGMPVQPAPAPAASAPRPPAAESRPARGTSRKQPSPSGRVTPVETQPPSSGGGAATVVDTKCVPMKGRFLLAINKADIVDVLEQASRWTCRNFAYTEDTARGKITLISKTPVSADEAYAAFLAALTANGIAIYPSGRYYKLVRIADAKKVPIPTVLEDGSEVPATEQPMTKVMRLRYADADQLRGVLSNFTSPQGADIQSIPPDVLLITDIGLNIRRIERMVDAIDRPGTGDLIKVLQVNYAPVKDVADKVNQVFAQQPGSRGRRTIVGSGPGQPPPPPGGGGTEMSVSKVMADERTNKLIVISDEKSYQRILELVKQLDIPTSGEGGIHVVALKNANAEDLAQTLQALAQGQATSRRTGGGQSPVPTPPPGTATPAGGGRGGTAELFSGEVKITADKSTNSLVVLSSTADFGVITRLIEKLDRPRRQVFVEAVIMEVNLTNNTEFGVGMHTAIPVKTKDGTGFVPIASEPGRVNSLRGIAGLAQMGGLLTGLQGPVSAELKDILPAGITSLAVYIQALQSSSDVNVLSTPHVLASDNEEAEISVGQNVPFQAGYNPGFNLSGANNPLSGSGNTNTNTNANSISPYLTSLIAPIQRQNVELKLKIKPQIGEGETVRLELDEQTEDIDHVDQQLGPTTNKRSVKTKIVARDQNTVVIGGLIQDRAEKSVKKVPLLGDIPVLGWLFRDTITSKRKTNLILFLTPYIIRDQSDYRRIFERKRKEHQEFMEAFYGSRAGYEVPVDYDRKPGPYARIRKSVDLEQQKLENGGPGAPGEHVVRPPQESGRAPTPTPGDSNVTPALPPEEDTTPRPSTPEAGKPQSPAKQPQSAPQSATPPGHVP